MKNLCCSREKRLWMLCEMLPSSAQNHEPYEMKFNIFIQKGCPKKGDLTSTLILMYWANGLLVAKDKTKETAVL